MATIRVTFPPVLERFLSTAVKQGVYPSREAAIIAAVDHEQRCATKHSGLTDAIGKGRASGSAGEFNIEDVVRLGRGRTAACKRRVRN
jgi:Arc/MetJ-type ribon-helix-helix transcriptional regulator